MIQAPTRPDPYERGGCWFWYDETGDESGPYPTERAARMDLLKYARYLYLGPDPTKRAVAWYEIKRFWRDTRGTS